MLSIFAMTSRARLGSSFGSIGGSLTIKLVNPIKFFSSDLNQLRTHEILVAEAYAHEGTGDTTVIRKPNPAVRQESSGLDLPDRVFDESAVLVSLTIRKCGAQVLDLGRALPNEYHHRDFWYACHPRVAEELGIECEQACWLFRIAR